MSIAAIIALLQVVVQELPGAISTAEDLYNLGVKFGETLKGGSLTDQERADLKASIASDLAEALTPLPAAQPGDPDYVDPNAPTPPATPST